MCFRVLGGFGPFRFMSFRVLFEMVGFWVDGDVYLLCGSGLNCDSGLLGLTLRTFGVGLLCWCSASFGHFGRMVFTVDFCF